MRTKERAELIARNARLFTSRVGMAVPGSHAVFRGQDLHAALRREDWVALFAYGITGRSLSAGQIRMVHALWVCTSYPDGRIWNNRVALLAGSARSTPALGISAALAVSEATVYGGKAGLQAIDFLQRCRARIEGEGATPDTVVAAELDAGRRIYGYGRPIHSTDERIPWVMEVARELGLHEGPFVRLAFEIEAILVRRNPKLKMNYAALHAALVADMGLSAREYQLLRIPTFLAGMPPCFVEAAQEPAAVRFPTPCEAVRYDGPPIRRWSKSTPDEKNRKQEG